MMTGALVVSGAAAILLGGIWVACSLLESENGQKADEIARRKQHYDELSRERETALAQSAKAKDVQMRMALLRTVVQSADAAEKDAYRQWREIKASVEQLKQQMKAAFARKEELRRELQSYKKRIISEAKGKYIDFKQDKFVTAKIDELHQMSLFCDKTVAWKRARQESKKEIWEVMQSCNRQKQQALGEMRDFKETKSYFMCSECGHRFAMTAGELEFYDRKGLHVPKRCKSCRENRA